MSKAKPSEITSIWDNGGESFDRYTFVVDMGNPWIEYIGASLTGEGYSQWGELKEAPGDYLGKKVSWDDLGDEIKNHIIGRLK